MTQTIKAKAELSRRLDQVEEELAATDEALAELINAGGFCDQTKALMFEFNRRLKFTMQTVRIRRKKSGIILDGQPQFEETSLWDLYENLQAPQPGDQSGATEDFDVAYSSADAQRPAEKPEAGSVTSIRSSNGQSRSTLR